MTGIFATLRRTGGGCNVGSNHERASLRGKCNCRSVPHGRCIGRPWRTGRAGSHGPNFCQAKPGKVCFFGDDRGTSSRSGLGVIEYSSDSPRIHRRREQSKKNAQAAITTHPASAGFFLPAIAVVRQWREQRALPGGGIPQECTTRFAGCFAMGQLFRSRGKGSPNSRVGLRTLALEPVTQ